MVVSKRGWLQLMVVALTGLWLAGCQTTGGLGQEGDGSEGAEVIGGAGAGAEGAGGATARGVGSGTGFSGHPLDDPMSPLSNRVFYFDFDSSRIRDADRDVLAQHGTYIAEHGDAAIRLEGHADERGTREYNIALGERRAAAIRQLLVLYGVGSDQMQTVSYGEEQPAVMGHDEQSWQLNRRVELIYTRR